MTTTTGPANRLRHESSPYLQQHAHNPVDWYPWGEEALAKARREDRPILLSIGYSTCHWCHVMAHESFENPEIARIMNENFINIKVDREERPDLDDIYMNCVQMMTGRGGWPLTVFLTPAGKPFYGGTYFPPEDRGGMPGFPRLLLALVDSYANKRATVDDMAQRLADGIQMLSESPGQPADPQVEVLDRAVARLMQDADTTNGGFGNAPKFPPSLDLDFLGRAYFRTGKKEIVEFITFTLAKMALGGIYDQLGGGFHRYATDAAWQIPHFEKMLYDNALLVRRYLEAYQLTGDPWFAQVARETLDYVLAEMVSPEGGFYAAQDADSEGVEGKFFVWTPAEVEAVLGEAHAPLVCAALGVSPIGNFEHGTSVLHRDGTLADMASGFGLTQEQVVPILLEARAKLKAARDKRVWPHRDDKIITAWNALMISAMAVGAQVLGEAAYQRAAVRAARFLLDGRERTGVLRRVWGPEARANAFLEDYAYLAGACLDLFETDFDPAWLQTALSLTEQMEAAFHDEARGGYFYTPAGHEELIVRAKNFFDHAIPSGNAAGVHAMIRLYHLTENDFYRQRAQEVLSLLQGVVTESPRALSHTLAAQEALLAPEVAVTIVGDPATDPVVREMLGVIAHRYLPHRRLVVKHPAQGAELEKLAPAVQHYDLLDGKATAYVCQGHTCLEPAQSAPRLAELLDQVRPQPYS